VTIKTGRGPDGPTTLSALEEVLATIRVELGDDQVAARSPPGYSIDRHLRLG
jgi:hypothetical protein